MLDVSQQLRAMSGALQTLVQHSERSTPAGSDLGLCWRPNDFLTNDDQELSQGYRGDSSFDAHVASLTEAMRSEDSPYHDFRQLQILEGPQDRTPTTVPHPRRQAGADVEDRRITPLRPISKLLRLLQREKQLFFCELPIIDEQEFADSCRAVCFTTESYPLSTWITVNLGLFYLFHGLQSRHYTEIEVSSEDVDEYLELLSSNADMAAQSLRLCVEPSIKTCSALMMLGEYYCGNGQRMTAWSLITAASRMCLDLGLHRFDSGGVADDAVNRKRMLFWWIYSYDHGLAFTLGRSPTIHQYDITTGRPDFLRVHPGISGRLYNSWVDFVILAGKIQLHLFSASAQRSHESVRMENAKTLATRLNEIHTAFANITNMSQLQHDENVVIHRAIRALAIISHLLLAVVYRTLPVDHRHAHPLHFHADCVRAAQTGLTELVHLGETMIATNPRSWRLLLNVTLCFVPFTAFIVVTGEAIAARCQKKMALLQAVLKVLEPVVDDSPSTCQLYDTCRRFYQFAETVLLERGSGQSLKAMQGPSTAFNMFSGPAVPPIDSTQTMSQAEWEEIMQALEVELGAGASGAMAGDLDPFSQGWDS